MLRDLMEVLDELRKKILSSRILILSLVYGVLVFILCSKLFEMQIVQGEQFQNNYVQKTQRLVTTPSTRGNIYDRNGNLLAYNTLAYAVSIQDNGYYRNANERNLMIYRLVNILHEYDEKIIGELQIGLDEKGEYYFTSGSEGARKRFLRDIYGLRSVDELDDAQGKYPSNITAAQLIEKKYKDYELGELKASPEDMAIIALTPRQVLDIINIRYSMSFTAYHRYDATKVASGISELARAALLENKPYLLGVNIDQETLRHYNDSIYFSSIIGYTGKVQEAQLEELRLQNPDYDLNDTVGRIGIERYMETQLQGKKGFRIINVDNVGHILEVKEETEASAGNNVHLTIDRNLQIGIYHLLEQHLAGVLVKKIVNDDQPNTEKTNATDLRIPVKDAYYQLISNNVLSLAAMEKPEANAVERGIFEKYIAYRDNSLSFLREELMNPEAGFLNTLPEDTRAYMYFIFNRLSDAANPVIDKDAIDTTSDYYQRWKEDTISLRELLYIGIEESWIDTTKLEISDPYLAAEDIYSHMVDRTLEQLKEDRDFAKLTYKYMIRRGIVTGRELCMALFEQGVLAWDVEAYNQLSANGETHAYQFFMQKIANIEITPAQLALDPCTAGAVITDTRTGEVRALVSYPGYDANRLSNVMDVPYYNSLLADQSNPLYNNATQAIKAPGSTFKPITAIAGLEEGAVTREEEIICTGEYDIIFPTIRCWIYPGSHKGLNLDRAIENSCNYYFAEVAHRLSTDGAGNYSVNLGIEKLREYASLFGLDHKSGVEIEELSPIISADSPEHSAMGQGSHSFANIQLSRFVSAIANEGKVFELSLLDRITDGSGNTVQDFSPEVLREIAIQDSTWDSVRTGMHNVVHNGSASKIFKDLEIDIAGKTGTAQESRSRGNHAFFISFGPYANPEIAVTVNIPFGYSSSNAASAAKDIYRFYFGYNDLESIYANTALNRTDVKIGD